MLNVMTTSVYDTDLANVKRR